MIAAPQMEAVRVKKHSHRIAFRRGSMLPLVAVFFARIGVFVPQDPAAHAIRHVGVASLLEECGTPMQLLTAGAREVLWA